MVFHLSCHLSFILLNKITSISIQVDYSTDSARMSHAPQSMYYEKNKGNRLKCFSRFQFFPASSLRYTQRSISPPELSELPLFSGQFLQPRILGGGLLDFGAPRPPPAAPGLRYPGRWSRIPAVPIGKFQPGFMARLLRRGPSVLPFPSVPAALRIRGLPFSPPGRICFFPLPGFLLPLFARMQIIRISAPRTGGAFRPPRKQISAAPFCPENTGHGTPRSQCRQSCPR